jgi:hypothetical protein
MQVSPRMLSRTEIRSPWTKKKHPVDHDQQRSTFLLHDLVGSLQKFTETPVVMEERALHP